MKTNPGRPRKPLTFAASRWAAYATASAATALAAASTAEAEIHHSGEIKAVFRKQLGTLQRTFPLDNGAALLFRQIAVSTGNYFDYALFEVLGPGGAFRGRPAHQFVFKGYVEKLHAGDRLNHNRG